MAHTTKIILIEKAFLLAAGIDALVSELSGVLVEHVYSGNEPHLIRKVLSHKPDVIILDPNALGDDFVHVAGAFQQEADIKLIGLLSNKAPEHIKSRFQHRLNRDDCKYDLLEGLRRIIGNTIGKPQGHSQSLSKREAELLREVCLGFTNQEIADRLFLSVHTVMTHRKNITKKLGIKTVSGLTVYALMNNLVDMQEMENRR